jgi:hypothetical protein
MPDMVYVLLGGEYERGVVHGVYLREADAEAAIPEACEQHPGITATEWHAERAPFFGAEEIIRLIRPRVPEEAS